MRLASLMMLLATARVVVGQNIDQQIEFGLHVRSHAIATGLVPVLPNRVIDDSGVRTDSHLPAQSVTGAATRGARADVYLTGNTQPNGPQTVVGRGYSQGRNVVRATRSQAFAKSKIEAHAQQDQAGADGAAASEAVGDFLNDEGVGWTDNWTWTLHASSQQERVPSTGDRALVHAVARVRASGAGVGDNQDLTLFHDGTRWQIDNFGFVTPFPIDVHRVTVTGDDDMLMGADGNSHSAETNAVASTPRVGATAPPGTGWHTTTCYLNCNIQTH